MMLPQLGLTMNHIDLERLERLEDCRVSRSYTIYSGFRVSASCSKLISTLLHTAFPFCLYYLSRRRLSPTFCSPRFLFIQTRRLLSWRFYFADVIKFHHGANTITIPWACLRSNSSPVQPVSVMAKTTCFGALSTHSTRMNSSALVLAQSPSLF